MEHGAESVPEACLFRWPLSKAKRPAKPNCRKNLVCPWIRGIPLFGNITRLADQKGVDIQLGALEEMLGANMQFVLLGSGSPDYEKAYAQLAKRYPIQGRRPARIRPGLVASDRGRIGFLPDAIPV